MCDPRLASAAIPHHDPRMTKLSPIVSEFETTEDAEAYDVWFRAKVAKALADPRPLIPHDEVMAEMKAIIEAGRIHADRRVA